MNEFLENQNILKRKISYIKPPEWLPFKFDTKRSRNDKILEESRENIQKPCDSDSNEEEKNEEAEKEEYILLRRMSTSCQTEDLVGSLLLDITLQDFDEADQIESMDANDIMKNIYRNLKILRDKLANSGNKTMFNAPGRLIGRMTGVSPVTLAKINDSLLPVEQRRQPVAELDSDGVCRKINTEWPKSSIVAFQNYVTRNWDMGKFVTSEHCVEWCKENINIKIRKNDMTKIIQTLKMKSFVKFRNDDARLIFLNEIETAREENCYIAYFSTQKFEETTILSLITKDGFLDSSIGKANDFYGALDHYLSQKIPVIAYEAKKVGRRAVVVVYQKYHLFFEERLPESTSTRWQLEHFLQDNGQIVYPTQLQSTLFKHAENLIERLGGRARNERRELEKVAKENNVEIIRLPQAEYVLNPMELIFGELMVYLGAEEIDDINEVVWDFMLNIDEEMTNICFEEIFEKEKAMKRKLVPESWNSQHSDKKDA